MDLDLKISSGPIFCHRCGALMIYTGGEVLECSACNAKKDAAGN
jgi:DNA-directed RNA polymerase subunit M/transcription elongation factor TFIIS